MNTTTKTITVAIAVVMIAISAIPSVTVNAELNTNDFEFTVHITDIIPKFTYSGISNFLSDNQQSYEDIDVFRFIIQDSNYYAVYNNNYDNEFVFAGIYENGAA